MLTSRELTKLLKTTATPDRFRDIAVAFLCERYIRPVTLRDGTGDFGVDAWIEFDGHRVAAQFYSGAGDWETKLRDDVALFAEKRGTLADAERADFRSLLFVCAVEVSPTKALSVGQEFAAKNGVVVDIYDAQAIASQALTSKSTLRSLVFREAVPSNATWHPSAAEIARAAFSFFHPTPRAFRKAVAKSAITACFPAGKNTAIEEADLLAQAASMIGIPATAKSLAYGLRDLLRSQLVVAGVDGALLPAPALIQQSQSISMEAAAERAALAAACTTIVEQRLPAGIHHRDDVARRAADEVLEHLGLLVRDSTTQMGMDAIVGGPAIDPGSRIETIKASLQRNRIADVDAALRELVDAAAEDPYARRLAAAELFFRFAEHDADELAAALDARTIRVLLDASVAMPMLCSLLDAPAPSWPASQAAFLLHRVARSRGMRCEVPTVYVEEMAAHLLRADASADLLQAGGFERSENVYVAHFCSVHGAAANASEFRTFLRALGSGQQTGDFLMRRRRVEAELRKRLADYGIAVFPVAAAPPTNDRPPQTTTRPAVTAQHDRDLVEALSSVADDEQVIVCTADKVLQTTLAGTERPIIAMDSAMLVDLLELVRPTGATERLLTPHLVASRASEDALRHASEVMDALVPLARARDYVSIDRARAFREAYLNSATKVGVEEAWDSFVARAPAMR